MRTIEQYGGTWTLERVLRHLDWSALGPDRGSREELLRLRLELATRHPDHPLPGGRAIVDDRGSRTPEVIGFASLSALAVELAGRCPWWSPGDIEPTLVGERPRPPTYPTGRTGWLPDLMLFLDGGIRIQLEVDMGHRRR